ncbi:interferon-stimulated 20 kDa exonuclease-like 2 isoform X3 [Microcaecilia unicolor]|uniref:Exonuclease XPMC2 n=1 Tax=Microcaecilia unicolor TaxID=1415580 RepID=A0A6P7WLH3_9AMPH|nr:interferon-stimulated 20 kDa exonuclease-like 2 isoform X3 [Microcaecilia unicolor]
MSDLIINLDINGSQPQWKASHPNEKHKCFLKRRRFLERKGFLKQKQLPQQGHQYRPVKPENAFVGSHGGSNPWERNKNMTDLESPVHSTGKRRPEKNTNSIGSSDLSHHTYQPKPSLTSNSSRHSEEWKHPFHSQLTRSVPREPKMGQGLAQSNLSSVSYSNAKDRSQPLAGTPKVSLLSEYESGLFTACPHKTVAIDCEMVGTGPGARHSELARCSIVSHQGDVVYDKYIKPPNPITNFRTRWSGIRKHHMKNATPFKMAQKEILKILAEKVVVGHAIHNDFKALCYFHPKALTRDTSQIPLLNRKAGFPENIPVSLKHLTKQLLNRDIQPTTAKKSTTEADAEVEGEPEGDGEKKGNADGSSDEEGKLVIDEQSKEKNEKAGMKRKAEDALEASPKRAKEAEGRAEEKVENEEPAKEVENSSKPHDLTDATEKRESQESHIVPAEENKDHEERYMPLAGEGAEKMEN